MKRANISQNIMAGLVNDSIEIFANGYRMLFTRNGKVQDMSKSPSDLRKAIQKLMYSNKKAVAILVEWCEGDVEQMEEQFTFCNFGGINAKPDYDSVTQKLNREAWACPFRGSCEGEGVICLPSNEPSLTNMEHKVFNHVGHNPEKPFKQVASDLHISLNTLGQHTKSIYRKIGIHSKPEFVAKAINTLI